MLREMSLFEFSRGHEKRVRCIAFPRRALLPPKVWCN